MALLFSVAATSLALDSTSEPNECTPKGLCEVATEVTDGNKLWSTSTTSTKHVSFAQELGMNCGVVELKDPCDTAPNECKIKQLYEKATIDEAGTKSWNSEAEAYVVVAKEYGLSCDVVEELKVEADKCKGGDTKSVKCRPIPIVPSDKEAQSSVGCSDNAKSCGDVQLCYYAATKASEPKSWSTSFPSHISEAKNRGLTCGIKEQIEVSGVCSDNNTKACKNKVVCQFATAGKVGKKRCDTTHIFNLYVLEAKKRGLTCGIKQRGSDFRQAFIFKSPLKRKQLQYALKELSFYTYGVDGLWGKGTKKGFDRFVESAGLEGYSEAAVFRELLSRVDVPNSFAAPKKKKTSGSKYKAALGYRPYGNTTMPVQQAIDVCKSGANNAFRTASDNARYKSNSYSGNCTSYGRSSNCRVRLNSPYGSDMGTALAIGIMEGISRGIAGNAARDREMKACMAHYGWRK